MKMSVMGNAYLWMMGSHLFNPSNYHSRIVEDGIDEKFLIEKGHFYVGSKLQRMDLFARKAKGWTHTFGKPIRYVARMVYVLAMVLFLSPFRILYNCGKVLENSFKWIRSSSGSIERRKHPENIKQHLIDLIPDLFALFFFVSPFFFKLPKHHTPLQTQIFRHRFWFMPLIFGLMSSFKELAIPMFVPKSDRLAAIKSMRLWEHFGLETMKGKLPRTNKRDNGEEFHQLLQNTTDRLLSSLSLLQIRLTDDCKIPYHFPPSKAKIVKHFVPLQEKLGQSEKELIEAIYLLFDQLKELETIFRSLALVRDVNLFHALLKGQDIEVKLPFLSTEEYVKTIFDSSIPVPVKPEGDECLAVVHPLPIPSDATSAEKDYLTKRNGFGAATNFYQALGVESHQTNEDIGHAFRMKSRYFHPDKVPEKYQEDGADLFRALRLVHAALTPQE